MLFLAEQSSFFSVIGHSLLEPPSREASDLLGVDLFSTLPFESVCPDFQKNAYLLGHAFESLENAAEFEKVQCDWLRLFIGVEKALAAPWSTVYDEGSNRQIFQEKTLEVRRWYATYGFVNEKLGKEPDDHIGLELLFLSKLICLESDAQDKGDKKRAASLMRDQVSFLPFTSWVDPWERAVATSAHTEYCRSLAKVARYGLVAYEKELVKRASAIG